MQETFTELLIEYVSTDQGRETFMQAIEREYQQMNTKTAGDPLPL